MYKVKFKASFLAALAFFLLPLLLNASYLLKNDLLKLEAIEIINEIGTELHSKTGINAYVLATNERFKEGYNLVEHSRMYEANMTKPYVLYIFAPYATITQKTTAKGRVGIIPSSDNVRGLYDYDDVRDAGIDVVAMKDSNTNEDKFNIGILQAYSVLSDNIAESKGLKLTKTIPDEMGPMVTVLRVIIYIGLIALIWIFVIRPYLMRRKDGK